MNHAHRLDPPSRVQIVGTVLFALTLVVGLYHVKWAPYVARAFDAAQTHSIGSSILMGSAADAPAASWHAARDYALAYGKAIWKALVLALVLGSAVQTLVPVRWIARTLGRPGFGGVLAGTFTALPAMMCSCCAAPLTAGLRRSRASAGGAMAFWLGNPVLNPATLVFIGFILGWQWAALRFVLGVLLVVGLGYAASRMVSADEAATASLTLAEAPVEEEAFLLVRWLRILARMTVQLVPEYAVMVLLLGAFRAWLFPHVGPEVGTGVIAFGALVLAGAVFVIPTAGEVPIVQSMLSLGMSSAPAAALLMTLPAISLPSLVMLGRSFPPRILALTCVTVVLFGALAGGCARMIGL